MDRYCMETDKTFTLITVHRQRCSAYHDTELLTENLAHDLGEFRSQLSALKEAMKQFPSAQPCSSCLDPGSP